MQGSVRHENHLQKRKEASLSVVYGSNFQENSEAIKSSVTIGYVYRRGEGRGRQVRQYVWIVVGAASRQARLV